MKVSQDPQFMMDSLLQNIYGLNRDRSSGHEKPHKPVLLLAALELIDKGLASPGRIPFGDDLREAFGRFFAVVRQGNDKPTIENPFYYLQSDGLTFVDAAHLIPFSESHNDHPSNGIALCKNHHWAMDRNLIAPGDDGRWHVSPLLKQQRSTGEAALLGLDGQELLPPHDAKFFPAADSLRWRLERLAK